MSGHAGFNSEPTKLGPLILDASAAPGPAQAGAGSPPSSTLAVSSRPGPLWPRSDRPRAARQRIWLLAAAGALVAAIALLARQPPERPTPDAPPVGAAQAAAPQAAAPQAAAPQAGEGKPERSRESAPARGPEPSAARPEVERAALPEPVGESEPAAPAAEMPDLVVSAGAGPTSRSVALSIASSPKRKPPRVQSTRSEPTEDGDESSDDSTTPVTRELAAPAVVAAPDVKPSPSAEASPSIAPPQVPTAPAPAPPVPVRAPPPAGVVREATPIAQSAPRFPARARRRGVRSGNVSIAFSVDRAGNVRNPVVVQSNPPGIFDEAALEVVNQWRYQPRLEAGVPVESHELRVRLLFSDGN
jgi:TonB family protein